MSSYSLQGLPRWANPLPHSCDAERRGRDSNIAAAALVDHGCLCRSFRPVRWSRPTGLDLLDVATHTRAWLDPEGATEAEPKNRTLTNLYNTRPTLLQHAHAALDRAVWIAYGWDDPVPAEVEEDMMLVRLLALNSERAEVNAPPVAP